MPMPMPMRMQMRMRMRMCLRMSIRVFVMRVAHAGVAPWAEFIKKSSSLNARHPLMLAHQLVMIAHHLVITPLGSS